MTRFTFPKNKHEFVALMKQRSQKERKRLVRYKLSFVIYSAFLAAFTLLGGQMSAQQRPIVWLAVLLGIVVAIVSLMVKTQKSAQRSVQFCRFYRRKLAEMGVK